MRKKDSNSAVKMKRKVKYTENKQKEQYMAGTEISTKKTSAIMSMLEQVVETRT